MRLSWGDLFSGPSSDRVSLNLCRSAAIPRTASINLLRSSRNVVSDQRAVWARGVRSGCRRASSRSRSPMGSGMVGKGMASCGTVARQRKAPLERGAGAALGAPAIHAAQHERAGRAVRPTRPALPLAAVRLAQASGCGHLTRSRPQDSASNAGRSATS